jgi:hypothetical protein
VGIYHASTERSFGEIPLMKPKILTSEVVEGKLTTQEVLKNVSSYVLLLPFDVLKVGEIRTICRVNTYSYHLINI